MQIKIAVLIGDNGEWYPTKYQGADTDWGFAADCIGIYDEKTHENKYPTSDRQYVITAEVDVPTITESPATKVEVI